MPRRVVTAAVSSVLLVALHACASLNGLTDSPADAGLDADGPASADAAVVDAASPTPKLGGSCSTESAKECAGRAQRGTMLCAQGVWAAGITCAAGTLCDGSPGPTHATCRSIDPLCSNSNPGDVVCDAFKRVTCGPDLVSTLPLEECANVCVLGQCKGECRPGAKQCGQLASGVEACSAAGMWGSPVACSSTTCVSGACVGVCAYQEKRCNGKLPETCDSTGQWTAASACAGANVLCAEGSCIPGRRVFVTKASLPTAYGGATGGDAKCAQAATAAGLPGTWKAWLSDASSSPSTRFTQSSVPYVNMAGQIVAQNWADLTKGTLAAAIGFNELGAAADVYAATSTNEDGTGYPVQSCAGWTSTTDASGGRYSHSTVKSMGWSIGFGLQCGSAPLYCFEQ